VRKVVGVRRDGNLDGAAWTVDLVDGVCGGAMALLVYHANAGRAAAFY